jgi:hypothetical protein
VGEVLLLPATLSAYALGFVIPSIEQEILLLNARNDNLPYFE